MLASGLSLYDKKNIKMADIKKPVLYLVGDSITQFSFDNSNNGWGGSLANLYIRHADVINRGYSGYNSRWIRQLIQKVLPVDHEGISKIKIVTLWLGANDATDETAGQHVPLTEYKDNMIFIINYIKSIVPSAVLILITPPDVDSSRWPTRSTDLVTKYANVIREISQTNNTLLVDLWISSYGVDGIKQEDLSDGLHLASSGNQKVYEKVKGLLLDKHPELVPDTNESVLLFQTHFPLRQELLDLASTEDILDNLVNWKYS